MNVIQIISLKSVYVKLTNSEFWNDEILKFSILGSWGLAY